MFKGAVPNVYFPGRPVTVVQPILAEIILGSPSSSSCSGLGICKLFPPDKIIRSGCPGTQTWISLHPENKLQLLFYKNKLADNLLLRHFANPFFQVEDALHLPKWLCKKLMIKEPLIIWPGAYLRIKTPHYITVSF